MPDTDTAQFLDTSRTPWLPRARAAQLVPPYIGGGVKPAPQAWQFVLLSLLLHVWMIALFGDAGGDRGSADGWASTFSARLKERGQPIEQSGERIAEHSAGRKSVREAGSTVSKTADRSTVTAPDAAPREATNEVRVETTLPPLPEVTKIPTLARESVNEASPLVATSVAPIAAAPLPVDAADNRSAPLPLVAPLMVAPLATPKNDATFTIAVPIITERAMVAPAAAARIDVAPLLPLPSLPNIVQTRSTGALTSAVQPIEIAPIVLPPPSLQPGGASQRAAVDPPTAIPIAPLALRPLEVPSAGVNAPSSLVVPALPIQPVDVPLSTRAPAPVPSIDIPVAKPASTAPAVVPPSTESQAGSDTTAVRASEAPPSVQAAPVRALPPADAGRATGSGPPALLNAPVLPPAATLNARPLDLDALRRQARELSREGSGPRALLPFPTLPKEASKREIEKAFDKALKRPDCNEAYRDMGLAAVIPLVRDAIRDDGCRWQSPAPAQPQRAAPPR